MTRLHVQLLGGFGLRTDGDEPLRLPTRKAEALLAYLAVRPGVAHPREKLAALLWSGTTDEYRTMEMTFYQRRAEDLANAFG